MGIHIVDDTCGGTGAGPVCFGDRLVIDGVANTADFSFCDLVRAGRVGEAEDATTEIDRQITGAARRIVDLRFGAATAVTVHRLSS